jgi:hypothetical protein
MTVSFAAKHDALPLVLSESETARALCISSDTLRRLGERGQAPQWGAAKSATLWLRSQLRREVHRGACRLDARSS